MASRNERKRSLTFLSPTLKPGLPGPAFNGDGMMLPPVGLAAAHRSRKPRLQADLKKSMPINPAMIPVFR
jgi:hypothetical protein